MNKKENQRYQETCQRIKDAVTELLEEKDARRITVSEICRKAQVHRTTFYGHYKDVPDLMNHMAGQMFAHVMEGFKLADDETPGEGFVKLFYYIRDNRQIFRRVMDYYGSRRYEFALLPSRMNRHIRELTIREGYEDEESAFYYYIFFTEGFKAVIYRWLERDCKESPEKMWKIIEKEYSPLRNAKIQKRQSKERNTGESGQKRKNVEKITKI